MKGQWIGRTTGDQIGQIIINIDDRGTHYSGVAFTTPDNNKSPTTACFIKTEDKHPDFNLTAFLRPIDPITGLASHWADIQNLYPGISHSNQAKISGRFKENHLIFYCKTDLGIRIESQITRKPFSSGSDIPGTLKSWNEYKQHVATLSATEYYFRGQANPWKLRTAFHRRGRYDLSRFIIEDIPKLHRRLTARTKHVFNLDIPRENGAFFNLAQHHGYPTPLLDWTLSPYVAAFFAFRNVPKNASGDDVVRIFIFDQEKWKLNFKQFLMLDVAGLHLSILDFLAIDNERLIPQQAATTVTNIDDIESYIASREQEKNCRYLSAINIPIVERNNVMRELSYMGITAGSMFPGLDGACEELREKLFDE